MGRTYTVVKLPPEQQSRIDALLRRYQYRCFDLVKETLDREEIVISRSALARYSLHLKRIDALRGNTPDSTIVTVLDLRTGDASQVRTAATPAAVIAAIGELSPLQQASHPSEDHSSGPA